MEQCNFYQKKCLRVLGQRSTNLMLKLLEGSAGGNVRGIHYQASWHLLHDLLSRKVPRGPVLTLVTASCTVGLQSGGMSSSSSFFLKDVVLLPWCPRRVGSRWGIPTREYSFVATSRGYPAISSSIHWDGVGVTPGRICAHVTRGLVVLLEDPLSVLYCLEGRRDHPSCLILEFPGL